MKVKQFVLEMFVCLYRLVSNSNANSFRYPPHNDGFLSLLAKIKASLIKPRHSKGQEPVSLLGRVIGVHFQ